MKMYSLSHTCHLSTHHLTLVYFIVILDWSERFLVLVERYSDIIKGQMYAHVHEEYFAVMRGSNNQPVGIGHVNPSLTTFVACHPSFRIYEMNEFTHDLIDYTQYHLNLTKSNKELNPYWEVGDNNFDSFFFPISTFTISITSFLPIL